MDALVDDFTARRPAGLEEAYALWARVLFSVARAAVNDDAWAEDCVHDALVRVWRAPNHFAGNRAMLRAYLIACVRNESIATLRSQSRRDARESRAARLRAALERLPADQRTALERAYYGNRTHVEIAAELGVPLGTIKSRIAMAMRKLQTELTVGGETRT
jgi:RNA polymerase sigma-70 factor (ECF subfamily)